jgi:hypothetical protein
MGIVIKTTSYNTQGFTSMNGDNQLLVTHKLVEFEKLIRLEK